LGENLLLKQFCQERADADISISDEMAVQQPSEKSTIKMKQVPIVANPYQQNKRPIVCTLRVDSAVFRRKRSE
jgi:hypothetical protein